jgi:Ca-activated chloride channel family protein
MRLHVFAIAMTVACGGGEDGGGGGGGGGVGLGGAQDIGQFRAILDSGGIPGEATLDANGFFSEHYAEAPPADCGQPLCVVGMMAVGRDWTAEGAHAVLQISLSTPIDASELEREPLDMVVVVDTSGSMSDEDRIGYARSGLHRLIDAMEEGDRLALVTYSDAVQERWTLSQPFDRVQLHAVVDGLYADGNTNLHDGLERGLAIASGARTSGRQSRVVLLSDGLANIGVSDDASIRAMAEAYLSDGIGLTTIGVGLSFNVELMRGLAERGAGNFYFLESPTAIAEVFLEELDVAMTPIALDVEVAVTSADGWSLGEVIGTRYWAGSPAAGWVGFPAVFAASRVSDDSGELGRRGAGGALFVTMLPDGGDVWESRGWTADVTLRYRMPDGGELLEQTVAVSSEAQPTGSAGEVWLSHEAMAEHYAMHEVYRGLRQATRDAGAGLYDTAIATLERLDGHAATWVERTGDPDVAADRMLIAQFEGNLRAGGAYVDPYAQDPTYQQACSASAGGSDGGIALLLACALVGHTRRRRRATISSARPARRTPAP